LPFCQLLDPISLLEFPLTTGNDEVRYPGVVIKDESFRAITGGKGNCFSVGVQASLEVLHLISDGEVIKGVLLLPLLNGGSEALGNVEYSDWAILVKFHHIVSSVEGDGSQRSRGRPYGG
jgi:hypothetical protein